MKLIIEPSILSADFGRLDEEIASVEAYSDRIHVDVMDGHFVPNISFGAPVMRCIKSTLPKDVHLMIYHPWEFFDDFVAAGATMIIVHEEVCDEYEGGLCEVLELIRSKGVRAGVSIKPGTELSVLNEALEEGLIDQVLIMTVEPGFGGQEFIYEMVPKIKKLREGGYEGEIGVDGGINADTAMICREAGADVLIAGSYVFGAEDRVGRLESLR